MENNVLTLAEEQIMKATFKATMLRAAAIIDGITNDHVVDYQVALHRDGVKLTDLAKIDRAVLASVHLRMCAEHGEKANERLAELIKDRL